MDHITKIKNELNQYKDIEKAEFLPKFFKAFPGGYGGNDRFIGVAVPQQRKIAKKYYRFCSLSDVKQLLNNIIHEYRLTALFILVYKFEKLTDYREQKEIIDFYLRNIEYINNWDLVDSSAYKLLGAFLINEDKSLLYKYAKSKSLWKQRIAIITTFYFIRNKKYDDTLNIAEILLNHKHDLIHKAVGWMLREIGNRDFNVELNFLKEHYKNMPRTMLRYAIEKFDEKIRQQFLKGMI